jgi:multidrug efflux pump subunit AcrA (membrane-fusion protein)
MSIQLGGETRFLRAAFGLCNQLAVRFGCDRVCLGWFEGAYVRLVAVSHVEKFDRRANAARDLETAMEEAATQDAEIVWPPEGEQRVIARAHEAYARAQGASHLLCLPLRIDGEVCAVLSLERREAAVDQSERFELRLIAEACARPLRVLRHSDRWFGARAFAAFKRGRDALLGPSYTAWKLIGIGVAAVAVVLAVLPWPYRIEAPIALRSSDIVFVPAPFDGYLKRVHVEVGDATPAGAPLIELDTRELILEESMAFADELRYAREAEKAQAARQLADMQISLARQQQSGAKLELIRHQIASAQVKAPFAGVVVEGDLRKNLGAPVRKGDLLLKLAHTANLYLELEVDQVDIHEVRSGMTGAFAFVGRPDLKYPVEVERIDPAATMREGRNVYLVRARIDSTAESWWRPGMGGAVRLDAGDRPAIWIITHRTVRFLRQVFWL